MSREEEFFQIFNFFHFSRIRGTLGSFFVLMASTGVLIGYIFGAFMTYDTCVWIYMLFPVAFLIGSFLLRETPFYLVKKNNFEVGN